MAYQPPETAGEDSTAPPLIGQDGRPIRVLSFGGGGFDTVMQLGVAHALLVIQGRAPDAVVGISAGAIQAVALAEILQAGDEFSGSAKDAEGYSRRMEERVVRFRRHVRACYRAPEALLDALLPDAYQIDARDPLEPLRLPRFSRLERDSRQQHLIAQSGLVRLYNDLLAINLSLGTLTRFVRRLLGVAAAGEIRSRAARHVIRLTELARLWILIGSDLHRIASTGWLLIRPILAPRRRQHVAAAGSLIFRFRSLQRAYREVRQSLLLLFAICAWLSITLTVLAPLAAVAWPPPHWRWIFLLGAAYLLVATTVLKIWFRHHDPATRITSVKDFLMAHGALAWLCVGWSAVLLVLLASFRILWLLATGNAPYDMPFSEHRDAVLGLFLCVLGGVLLVLVSVAALVALVYVFLRVRSRRAGSLSRSVASGYMRRLLDYYDLSKSVFHTHGVEHFLAELLDLDRDFYGRANIDNIVEDSLVERVHATSRGSIDTIRSIRKTIGHYSQRTPQICVAIAVADAATGDMEVVPPTASVVDGLLSAISVVPLLPAATGNACGGKKSDRLLIDATNISNDPTRALLKFLRNGKHVRVNEHADIINVYRVSPLPFSTDRLGPEENQVADESPSYVNLVDIAIRANKLRRFRDAGLQRRLTELYTRVIPPTDPQNGQSRTVLKLPISGNGESGAAEHAFFRMHVIPIELDVPSNLNLRILGAGKAQRQQAIAETIADGCRASLQAMIHPAIRSTQHPGRTTVPCGRAVRSHLRQTGALDKVTKLRLPGSRSLYEDNRNATPPGIWEICKQCCVKRKSMRGRPEAADREQHLHRQSLEFDAKKVALPSWPHELVDSTPPAPSLKPERRMSSDSSGQVNGKKAQVRSGLVGLKGRWPKEDLDASGSLARPTISVIFSGGVFRGVFQVGVVNALSQLGLRPDIIAGASIGSITAAMSARALRQSSATLRQIEIARVAATYLGVDRIVLTDRFAELIRGLTLRAAGTAFSLRDADHLFRRYDFARGTRFGSEARRVIAGIERLFYVSPYQLNALLHALRNRASGQAGETARALIQQWLDRMHVGIEVLGAEPIELLIRRFVLGDDVERGKDPDSITFDTFLDNGLLMLATTTDITAGRLCVLGDPEKDPVASNPRLVKGLLASSAFPAVFQPRYAWEIAPACAESRQFIDGGVMDNLPIAAVTDLLGRAADAKLINHWPYGVNAQAPHLVIAASLEPRSVSIDNAERLRDIQSFWPSLYARTRELGYNKKIRTYQKAQRELREIYRAVMRQGQTPSFTPVNIEVIDITPNWLCGTFGFHPMLGFRRRKQAQSIAHGCASTLLRFRNVDPDYQRAWSLNEQLLPHATTFAEAHSMNRRWKAYATGGACWLRPGTPCPFSEAFLNHLNSALSDEPSQSAPASQPLSPATIREVSEIHRLCQLPETHLRTRRGD